MDGRATMRAESAIPSSVGGFGARLWRPRHRDECGPPRLPHPGPRAAGGIGGGRERPPPIGRGPNKIRERRQHERGDSAPPGVMHHAGDGLPAGTGDGAPDSAARGFGKRPPGAVSRGPNVFPLYL